MNILDRISILHGLVSALAATLSATLIKSYVLPEQLSSFGIMGTLIVFVALLVFIAFRPMIARQVRIWAALSVGLLLIVLFTQIFFVKRLDNYLNPPATHNFIVGVSLNDQGRQDMSLFGVSSIDDLIRRGGWKRIPSWYDWDLVVMEALYAGSYLGLLFAIVFTMGAASSRFPVPDRPPAGSP